MDYLNILKSIGLYFLFAFLITYSWRWYELKAFGEITPDPFHTIIAIILANSLTLNVILFSTIKQL